MGKNKGRHFDASKRAVLANMLARRAKAKDVAAALGVDPTSVSREIARNRIRRRDGQDPRLLRRSGRLEPEAERRELQPAAPGGHPEEGDPGRLRPVGPDAPRMPHELQAPRLALRPHAGVPLRRGLRGRGPREARHQGDPAVGGEAQADREVTGPERV